ncbi:hypothetical protein [Microvirga pakistanensis]|uniref:hypothetical protein n=1 Tax=Microvirga pakistanensis TaxID=1682650 RepID=UPI00106BE727|nr:hypothetical protein [Microvirga pakistanensis]
MSGRLPWFRCRPTPLLAEIAGMQADEGYVFIVLFLRILETGGPVLETSRTLARRTGLREQRIVAALEALLATGKIQRLSDGQLVLPSRTRRSPGRTCAGTSNPKLEK